MSYSLNIPDLKKAQVVKDLSEFSLGDLSYFKGDLKKFQQRGVAFMYFARRSLLLDATGLGKTIQLIGLLSLLKERRELRSALYVTVPYGGTPHQHYAEFKKFSPRLNTYLVKGSKLHRAMCYNRNFDVLITDYGFLWRDKAYIEALNFNVLLFDECSYFKNHDAKTSQIVKELSAQAFDYYGDKVWIVGASATPVQKGMLDFHSIIELLHIPGWRNKQYFENRYCVKQKVDVYTAKKRFRRKVIVGYKNLAELKKKTSPFFIRRLVADVDEELPDIVVENKWVDLSAKQQSQYDSIRRHTANLLTAKFHSRTENQEIVNRFHSLNKLCYGLSVYDPKMPDVSSKFDEVIDLLTGDLSGEKVVIFCAYKSALRQLSDRMKENGIQYVQMYSDVRAQYVEAKERFWKDENVSVCIGTTALEMSHNLQIARYLIMLGLIYNPKRVEQVIGRIRRIGSKHKTCVIINMLARGTLEQKMWSTLRREAAISDYMFDEQNEVFGTLSKQKLMMLLKD